MAHPPVLPEASHASALSATPAVRLTPAILLATLAAGAALFARGSIRRVAGGFSASRSTKAGRLLDVAESAHAWSKRDVAAQFRLEPIESQDPVVSHIRIGRHPRIVLLHVRTILCEIPAEGQPSRVVAFVRRIHHRVQCPRKAKAGPWGNRLPGFAPNVARDSEWRRGRQPFFTLARGPTLPCRLCLCAVNTISPEIEGRLTPGIRSSSRRPL